MSGCARAIIDLDALSHNFGRVKTLAPHTKVMAVVKDNAYGHGAVAVARHLHMADALAVASLQEAKTLRGAGINRPILLLSGVYSAADLLDAAQLRLSLVLHQADQLKMLQATRCKQPVSIWLKINTGMNRLGFEPHGAAAVLSALRALPHVDQVVLMTHFSEPDDLTSPATMVQFKRAEAVASDLALPRSYAKSAAIMAWPQTHVEWVRPGIMLYGVSPFRQAFECDLRQVMHLESRLIAIQLCDKGDSVSYGGLWHCPEAMRVGLVGVGYGDGYPQRAGRCEGPGPSGKAHVLINGQACNVVGLVAMDIMAVDLRPLPCAKIGDRVTLWNDKLPVETVARLAGVSPYELLCRVSARVKREPRGSNFHPQTMHALGEAYV